MLSIMVGGLISDKLGLVGLGERGCVLISALVYLGELTRLEVWRGFCCWEGADGAGVGISNRRLR